MLIRHGVLLSPKLADIFDLIERSGERGITPGVLIDVFYPGKSTKAALAALKANIWLLNEKLVEADLRVKTAGRLVPYRVVKVTGNAA